MKFQLGVKRLVDLICSFAGLVLLLPLFVVIGVAVKLDSAGPIFFKQVRGGLNGRHFKIYKFRTMCDKAVNQGMGLKTTANDPRITRMGHFLRKTSLDELPQLINVLVGQMSLIGPRPTLTIQTDNYTDYQRQRLKMKPGITGYAQVNGRNALSWDEKIDLDIYYVNNFSLWLDLKIFIKTIFVLFKFNQVYNTNRTKNVNS